LNDARVDDAGTQGEQPGQKHMECEPAKTLCLHHGYGEVTREDMPGRIRLGRMAQLTWINWPLL
jgi:hypothetical protein